jgi:serine/threonine protein kinase
MTGVIDDFDLFSDTSLSASQKSLSGRGSVGKHVGPYILLDILGQGQYGCVQLAVHVQTQERVAIKVISKTAASANQVKKEVLIHRAVTKDDPRNIIRLITVLEDSDNYYLVLEWAGGGELFDLIEPDFGLYDEALIHSYFCQLITALDFVHKKGIAHRDIKPENLLLDDTGQLKLSDFGLSTLFMHEGRERLLTTSCGSPIYMAPEVIAGGEYHGPSADIWSCGVVLYVMIFGATPWDEASVHSEEFLLFRRGFGPLFQKSPLQSSTFDTRESRSAEPISLSEPLRQLLLGMLTIEWQNRYDIDMIKRNPWVNQFNTLCSSNLSGRLLDLQRRQLSSVHAVPTSTCERSVGIQVDHYTEDLFVQPDPCLISQDQSVYPAIFSKNVDMDLLPPNSLCSFENDPKYTASSKESITGAQGLVFGSVQSDKSDPPYLYAMSQPTEIRYDGSYTTVKTLHSASSKEDEFSWAIGMSQQAASTAIAPWKLQPSNTTKVAPKHSNMTGLYFSQQNTILDSSPRSFPQSPAE